jgi:SNF2 family DNA or RNA helicase
MTGSPIANRPYDLWSQIFFLDQGSSLGTNFGEFKQQFDIPKTERVSPTSAITDIEAQASSPIESLFENRLSHLGNKISTFTVRETKAGAGIELPGKSYEQILVDWEEKQYDTYCKVRDELKLEILRDGIPVVDDSEGLLKRLLRLVQVCSNPGLIDEGYIETPGKVPALIELIRRISSRQEKVIIWTCFVDNVRWLANILKDYSPVMLHGRMNLNQRDKAVKNFLDEDKVEILIATPQSSKEGLTLTVANNVVFFDRSFSLDDYIQAQDRIHRISQEKNCFVYNLIMRDSVETWVNSLLATKQAAASLGQKDIGLEEYQSLVRYDLGNELRTLLNMD